MSNETIGVKVFYSGCTTDDSRQRNRQDQRGNNESYDQGVADYILQMGEAVEDSTPTIIRDQDGLLNKSNYIQVQSPL